MNTNQDTTLTNQDSDKDMMGGIKVDDLEKMAKDGYPRPALSLAYGQGLIVGINCAKEKFKAATKASESEINSLKERIQELEEEIVRQNIYLSKLQTRDNKTRMTVVELTASNNQLRDALEEAKSTDAVHRSNIINKALSSTPAQSLAEHDNATIVRCKNIVADDALAITFQSMGAYRSAIIKHIGELKATL